MALPFQFGSVTTLVTPQLDANYNALGALTPIPCTVAGTNAIVMTPQASTATVAAYSNYMQFTGIAVATNTTTVTVAVGALAALNGYKDVASGPVSLVNGDIAINSQIIAIYDSALNSGNGGFHIIAGSSRMPISGGAFTGPVQFGSGNASLTTVLSASASIGWPNIGATASTVATIAVPGSSVGDCVFLGTPASVPAGITFFGWVNNAGTVTIQALNVTGSSITPVAGTYRAATHRYAP
jgi:hypothetical protein